MRLNTLGSWSRVVPRLGFRNVLRVAMYRMGVRSGIHPVLWQRGSAPQGPFWEMPNLPPIPAPPSADWESSARLFGRWHIPVHTGTPDWLANPLTGRKFPGHDRPWWDIPDFDPLVGDIKLIWELSRMDWVVALSQRARLGDRAALTRLNAWLGDWSQHNPPFKGPNWKCGQEASIRVLHLAVATLLLGQIHKPLPALQDLLILHLKRISPTLSYAVAQNNNHGTSEAAALFVGGSWLVAAGIQEGRRWETRGRRWLEDRVCRLVGRDGTFSQYSLNYHRVLLDTLSMVEVWRRTSGLPEFSGQWEERSAAATQWLYQMISPEYGDGPNIGANDGARLLPLTDADYRDFRGSVQLAMALFSNVRAYPDRGSWNDPLAWLGVTIPKVSATPPSTYQADDGGFAVLRQGRAMVLLRYPRFQFRPSHADGLHVDLWVRGQNLLRDAGSYSYNTDASWMRYFSGVESHNTVQFDDREQMPRLGRFLFGEWLKPTFVERINSDGNGSSAGAGYRDHFGATHSRRILLSADSLSVTDEVQNFSNRAVLRWRLAAGPWRVQSISPSAIRIYRSDTGDTCLAVSSSVPIERSELKVGWESLYYMERTELSVLEVEIRRPGVLTTQVTWAR